MRILHLASEFPPQRIFGLGRYVHELAMAQARTGKHVDVFTNSHGGDQHEAAVDGVQIYRVHCPPPPEAPSTSSKVLHFNLQLMERVLEVERNKRKYDVVNAHDWLTFPASFHLAHLLNVPLVTTIHDVIFNKVRGRPFNDEDAYIAGIENWACHTSARMICLSESVRHELVQHYHADPDRVAVIPGGVGIQPLSQDELSQIAEWRSKMAPAHRALILYVGRLDVEKGLETLFEAAQLLRQRRDDWQLVLIGQGQREEGFKRHCEKENLLSHIRFLGYLQFSELRRAYAAADILVVPSSYEPFGLVALEAQRMGTPVVAAMTGGLAETLTQTKGGVGFTPGNPLELCSSIVRLLDDEPSRSAMGSAAQAAVFDLFGWERVESSIASIYRNARSIPHTRQLPQPWTFARRDDSAVYPVADVTVMWSTARFDMLEAILDQLLRIHPLQVLHGKINVVPVVVSGNGTWSKPSTAGPIHYVDVSNPDAIKSALKQSATIVVDGAIRDAVLSAGLVVPKLVPTIWIDEHQNFGDGLCLKNVGDLYPVVGKLLCDDRYRKMLAPELFNPIPDVTWQPQPGTLPKVLHVLPQLVTGGAETTLLELVKGTSRIFDHEILVTSSVLHGPLPDEFKQLGIKLSAAGDNSPAPIIRLLRQSRPDLIHLHSMSYVPAWLPIHRLLTRQRIIETEHVVNIGSGHFGPADTVVCVSKAVKAAHEGFERICSGATKFEVIYNGLNPRDFTTSLTKQEARAKLGVPLGVPIIGRVSALARNKLPMEALQIVPLVLQQIPNAVFAIVGDGPERAHAESFVRERGLGQSVVFLGERRDIADVLKAFDLFAYYTTKDALGNVLLEARVAGLPIVTTAVEGVPEAMEGAAGELVPLNDLKAFADAVVRSVSSNAASGPLPQHFTRTNMAAAYESLYRSTVEARKGTADTAPSGLSRLLIKFPTRNRPDKFFDVLQRYIALLSGRNFVSFLVSCDEDDATMNNEMVRKRLEAYPGVRLIFGPNKSKVEAINSGMQDVSPFDVLLLASDDMVPQYKGYDEVILRRMHQFFPSTDGVLFFNDGFRGKGLNTLVIMGRKYYERFGYIYHTSYKSLWCDNEFTDVAYLLGRQIYFDEVIVRHEHPLNTGQREDSLYVRNEAPMAQDRSTYEQRKANRFGVRPRVVLSILITTIPQRRDSLLRLTDKLRKQMTQSRYEHNVEILSRCDDGEASIGQKRNELVSNASGEYVCFVDDDDDVADTYVVDIVSALADGCVDTVGLTGTIIFPNKLQKMFVHSLRYSQWAELDGVYYRPPNHLNPIRRDIALKYPFKGVNYEEDKDYSLRLMRDGALKTEVLIEQPLYLYYPSMQRSPGERPKNSAPIESSARSDVKLSVLIPSIPSRYERFLLPLYRKLETQIASRKDIELLVFSDNKQRSVGLKRDGLVQIATGRYLAFVDDDDDVADDYIATLRDAIDHCDNADVIVFEQKATINDGNAFTVRFGIEYDNEPARMENGRWIDIKRKPFHVCAWKSALAKRHRFPDASYGEDWHWARRVLNDVRSQHRIERVLHFYRYNDSVTEAAHVYPKD